MSGKLETKTFVEIAKGIIGKEFEDELCFLMKEYAEEDDEKLTIGAQQLKKRLLEEWVCVDALKQTIQTIIDAFPNLNNYPLPDGWCNDDLRERYRIYITDVEEWFENFQKFFGLLEDKK